MLPFDEAQTLWRSLEHVQAAPVGALSRPSWKLLPSTTFLVPVSYAASPTEFWCIND